MVFLRALWRTAQRTGARITRVGARGLLTWLLGGVWLAVVFSAPAVAQNTPAGNRPLGAILGVNTKFRQGEPQQDLALLTDLGVKWVREEIYWTDLEPQAGRYTDLWPATLQRLNFYRSNDIGVVMLLYGGNAAYGNLKTNPAGHYDPVAYGRFVGMVAARLQALGVRFVIEVWNEPHNGLQPSLGGQWNGRPPSPWLDHYLKIVREATKQVKAVDNRIKVINDDDMWVLHHWFLEGGLPPELDGFAIHPYAPRGPEKIAVDANTDWLYPHQVVDADASFQSAVRRLVEKGTAKLGHVPEIYITEWGWQLGEKSPYGAITEPILASLLPRAFMVAHASGVQAMTWFSLQDSVDGPMGLTDNRGHRREPYHALKALRTQLGNSQLLRQVLGQKRLTQGVQAYLYQPADMDSTKLAIWSIDGQPKPLVFDDSWRRVTVVDHFGKVIQPSTDAQGRRSVTVGLAPIYLSSVPDDATLASALRPLE